MQTVVTNRFETEHLAAEYVQNFELEHLEDVTIKREARIVPEPEWNNEEPNYNRQWAELHRRPPEEFFDQTEIPTTPPYTPSISQSPTSTNYRNEVWPPQPLDLRPQPCDPTWERNQFQQFNNVPQFRQYSRTLSIDSCSQLSPYSRDATQSQFQNGINDSGYSTCSEDLGISDELLLKLTVKELNKWVQGLDKALIVKLKQKRRTLKNRGYAQNCRSKRLQQKLDLEMTNRTLTERLRAMRSELERVTRERNMLKHQLQMLTPKNGLKESEVDRSPEFYL